MSIKQTHLVTGAAGFIGSHLCERLLEQNCEVIGLDNFDPYYDIAVKQRNLQNCLANPNFTFYETSIEDKAALKTIFMTHADSIKSTDGNIVHLAARAGVRPSIEEPYAYHETNVTGTLHIAELMKDHGLKKLTFASSSSVYGERGNNKTSQAFSETDDVSKPVSPYAATKVMCENLLHTYSFLYGLQVTALRFFTVYGPRQRPDLAIHKFTRLIDNNQPITVYGDGEARRDFTYIDDIIQGVVNAMNFTDFRQETSFEVFNLGESKTTTVNELVKALETCLDKKASITYQERNKADVTLTFANIDKARSLLRYAPTTPVENGLPRFVEWYRQEKAS